METREAITVDPRAQRRLHVLNHVLAWALTAAQAAELLELSLRQVRRLLAGYRIEGVGALVHGNRQRAPANRLDDELRARLLELASSTYADVNRAHLAELLAEREGIVVAERSLRRVLSEAGLPALRRRRPARHRSRRERMPRAGLLLQVDGSRHAWLEQRGPSLTLVGGIDDASGIVTGAIFREQEDAAGYFAVLTQTAAGYGLPAGLYSDRHGIFWRDRRRPPSLAEQLAGRHTPTQLGRALEVPARLWLAIAQRPHPGRPR
jgi:transposase